jgi:hypothetical protein
MDIVSEQLTQSQSSYIVAKFRRSIDRFAMSIARSMHIVDYSRFTSLRSKIESLRY